MNVVRKWWLISTPSSDGGVGGIGGVGDQYTPDRSLKLYVLLLFELAPGEGGRGGLHTDGVDIFPEKFQFSLI